MATIGRKRDAIGPPSDDSDDRTETGDVETVATVLNEDNQDDKIADDDNDRCCSARGSSTSTVQLMDAAATPSSFKGQKTTESIPKKLRTVTTAALDNDGVDESEPMETTAQRTANDEGLLVVAAAATGVTTTKTCESTENLPPLEMLPIKALQSILEFLDATPRELFRLVTSVKAFYRAIQPRPDIVVFNAFWDDGKIKTILDEIIGYIKEDSIHTPSTMRLMRLFNATRCERGDECFRYNLLTKTSALLDKKEKSKRPFGLCICKDCYSSLTVGPSSFCHYTKNKYIPGGFRRSGLIDHLPQYAYLWRLLREPFIERGTGVSVGPILFGAHLSQIMSTHGCVGRGFAPLAKDVKNKLADEFDSFYQAAAASTFGTDTDRQQSALILAIHQEAVSLNDRKKQALEDARQARIDKRQAKANVVLNELKDWLGELVVDYNWMFECTPNRWNNKLYFSVAFVDEVLGPFVRAPSKATKPKLAEAIMKLVRAISMYEKLSFLPHPDRKLCSFADENDPYEKALADYYRQNYQNILKKAGLEYNPNRPAFLVDINYILELAWCGDGVKALESVVPMSEAFSRAVASEDTALNKALTSATWEQRCKVAKAVYFNHRYDSGFHATTDCEVFRRCRSKYMESMLDIKRFRDARLIHNYCNGNYLCDQVPKQESKRRKVIEYIFEMYGRSYFQSGLNRRQQYDLLLHERDHETLLSCLIVDYNSDAARGAARVAAATS